MTSPINNPSTTNVTTTTTSTPVVTTSTSFGGHVVSTTGTGALETTAQTVNTTAEQAVAQAESDSGAVIFTTQRDVSTTAPTTGGSTSTATAASLLGTHILGTGRARTDSTSSSDSSISDTSTTSSTQDTGATGETQDAGATGEAGGTQEASGDVDLGDLAGLRGSEAADGAERAEGPGGLPSMALPKYDPTDKASIIKFLSTPSVQAKLQTKAGHIVFMDEARGSFIFVRNGDWSTAESIAVTNGKTKEPITDVKDLEMCIAKFCVGYESMQADWSNNIQPRVAGQTGETGHYDHLLMSMKFKTTVLYGPWNSKESSSGYTPSVWRRGTKCDSGPIWGDVGGLKGINWNNVAKPDATAFSRETAAPAQPQPGPYTPPVINVNLGGISTNVNVTGGTTTTTVTTSPTPDMSEVDSTAGFDEIDGLSTQDESTETDIDDVETQSTSTQYEDTLHYESGGEEVDNLAPAPLPPGPPPPAKGGVNITGMPAANLQQILNNVREHLDTVYDQNGVHHEGNQDLGTVVRTSENGTYKPTVLLKNDQGDGGRGVQRSNDDDGGELGNILNRVREHLDVVYPESNEGEPIPVNQNLGDVIQAVESGNTPKPTQPEGVFVAKKVNLDGDGNIVGGNARTSSESRASNLMSAAGGEGAEGLEHLLPQLRSHLDDAFDQQGNLVGAPGTNVGSLIKAFQERTGSGGIVAPLPASVVTSSSAPQQSATVSDLPKAQTAETMTPGGSPDLHGAAKGVADSLSNLLQAATPSTTSTTVSSPAPRQETATSTSVAGTRGTATPTTGGSPSGIPGAAANVTATLSSVANKIALFEKGARLQEALDSADTESTQGKQLLEAARNTTTMLSKTLSKVTGSPPSPPQRHS